MPVFKTSVPFSTPELASYALQVLEVDRELKPEEVQRHLSVDGCDFKIEIRSSSLKALRSSCGTFLDLLALTVETMEEFDTDN
ncbi:hypothetical protein HDU67_003709 [Dinochytrium kinnereticum]|nr:hypothetical protein HDU67_003709 [Dinochytrium kinnereticum]